MLDKKAKEKVIAKFRTHESDTGSSQVQIAILSEEIKELAGHLIGHKKDHSSRRGLLKKVSERRKLLRYLERENAEAAMELAKRLKIKLPKREVTKAMEEAEEAAAILEAENAQPVVETV